MNYREERIKKQLLVRDVASFLNVSNTWLRRLELGKINLSHPIGLDYRRQKIDDLEKLYTHKNFETIFHSKRRISDPFRDCKKKGPPPSDLPTDIDLEGWKIGDVVCHSGGISLGTVVGFSDGFLKVELKSSEFHNVEYYHPRHCFPQSQNQQKSLRERKRERECKEVLEEFLQEEGL